METTIYSIIGYIVRLYRGIFFFCLCLSVPDSFDVAGLTLEWGLRSLQECALTFWVPI